MRLIDADMLKQYLDSGIDEHTALAITIFKSMIDEQPTIPQWISCNDRLPDDERRVLCTIQSGEHFSVVPCVFVQHTKRWLPEVYGNHGNVIAWCELPEPWRTT